jgi:hypothetical protein
MDEKSNSGEPEDTDNEATLRLRQLAGDTPGPKEARQEARVGPDTQARQGAEKKPAREPAPTEANPLSEAEGRPLDRRDKSP